MSDTWTIEGREFSSRLLLGTAMYPSREVMLDALKASEHRSLLLPCAVLNLIPIKM